MRRRLLLVTAFFMIMAVACAEESGNQSEGRNQEGNSSFTEVVKQEPEFTDEDLTTLLNSAQPPVSQTSFEPVMDSKGFPAELVNTLGKAVLEDSTDSAIRMLDDKSLRLTEEEILDLSENLAGPAGKSYYRCTINGTDAIFVVSEHGNYYPKYVSMYVKDGESYKYSGNREIGAVRNYAFFQYDDGYYMAVNCNCMGIPDGTDARLYRIDSDFCLDKRDNHLCILKRDEMDHLQLIYKNDGFSGIDDVQAYLDEILYDLIDVGTGYGTFCGDETKQVDVRRSWQESGLELENLYSIDVDQDGIEEYFERDAEWFFRDGVGSGGEMAFQWFREDMQRISCPLTLWSSDSYIRKQTWFQVFDGKTVAFSLYHREKPQNQFVIDARIYENGKTISLLDYTYVLKAAGVSLYAVLSDHEGSMVYVPWEETYQDPDRIKALPENLEILADSLSMKVQEQFSIETGETEQIPPELSDWIKQYLSGDGASMGDFIGYDARIEQWDFLQTYEDDLRGVPFGDGINAVYRYEIDQNTYYVVSCGVPGITSLNYEVYKENNGTLSFYNRYSADDSAAIINCSGQLYLLEPSYPPYLAETRFLGGIDIHKLAPHLRENYASVQSSLLGYEWETIYDNHEEYGKAVTEYLELIKTPLMQTAGLRNEAGAFTGDEKSDLDKVLSQRLKSLDGDAGQKFYEIDFNNDGNPEYISKFQKRGYGSIIFSAYRSENKKIEEDDYDFRTSKNYLSQLWFKKLDDKIFTFKMSAENDYYYLNVSLIEGRNITQVQSYIIIPEREYSLMRGGKE